MKNVGKSLAENFYLWSLDFVCVISMSYDIRREILTPWLEKYSDSKVNKKENNRIENNSSVAFFDGNHNILFIKYLPYFY